MTMNDKKERIITRIKELTILLGGNMTNKSRVTSTGRTSKFIEIEYEINE